MTADEYMNKHPENTQVIYDAITRRMFMKDFRELHPTANQFQRKIVVDLAYDIIAVVVGDE